MARAFFIATNCVHSETWHFTAPTDEPNQASGIVLLAGRQQQQQHKQKKTLRTTWVAYEHLRDLTGKHRTVGDIARIIHIYKDSVSFGIAIYLMAFRMLATANTCLRIKHKRRMIRVSNETRADWKSRRRPFHSHTQAEHETLRHNVVR